MEISQKDILTIFAMAIIGIMIFLLIAFDPLDILNLDQKVILIVIISPVLLLLLSYQRQRIIKKKETKNKMEISQKDILTIFGIWAFAMTILTLIFLDPINILDSTQKITLAAIVMVANLPILLYQVKRIKNRTK